MRLHYSHRIQFQTHNFATVALESFPVGCSNGRFPDVITVPSDRNYAAQLPITSSNLLVDHQNHLANLQAHFSFGDLCLVLGKLRLFLLISELHTYAEAPEKKFKKSL